MSTPEWDGLVAELVGGDVTAAQMFGSPGLRVGKKFFATNTGGEVVLKLPQARVDELVGQHAGVPFEPMAGRTMGGWIVMRMTENLLALADEARTYVAAQARS